MRVIRRCFPAVSLVIFGTFAYAGRITSTFSLPNPVAVNAFQRDTTGHVYLSGNTGSTTGLPADSADAFVAKLSSAGTVLFWTTFGGSKADYVSAMAIVLLCYKRTI